MMANTITNGDTGQGHRVPTARVFGNCGKQGLKPLPIIFLSLRDEIKELFQAKCEKRRKARALSCCVQQD